MHSGHIPALRRTKTKPPSAAAQAASALQQQISQLTSRYELQAVSKGSHDPSAVLLAARILQQLTNLLAQHKSSSKQASCRALLQKQLPPELLLALLASGQDEVLRLTLQAVQELAGIVPAVVPLDAAPRLVQLLGRQTHGAAAARTLTAQLAHWRFSQLWPHWLAAGATSSLYQQLQQLHALVQTPDASGSNPASRAVDACVALLALLAKLVTLSEQQLLAQIAADVGTCSRWLQLLVQIGQQQRQVAGSHASLHLQDSCCALLAGVSHAPAMSLALLDNTQLRQSVLQLLHGVLRRPCSVSEADASHIQCWMHAASAASLPVLWQQPLPQPQPQPQHQGPSPLAPHEEQQLLADMAIAAAATLCNECFSSTVVAKQVDAAAASLLAAALLPAEGTYGSQRSCTSPYMAAVLGSNCCHVLLHALAVSTNTSSEQAALLAAAAAAATSRASTQAGSSRPATPDTQPADTAPGDSPSADVGSSVVLAPVQQDAQPVWLLLRMICAQCAAVNAAAEGAATLGGAVGTRSRGAPFGALEGPRPDSSSGGSGSWGPPTHLRQQMALLSVAGRSASRAAVQPEQVLRVVQAYSSHITTGSDAHSVPGLLRSQHFLMCQSVLVLHTHPAAAQRRQQQQQQQQQQDSGRQQQQQHQPRQRRQQPDGLQWLSLSNDGASSSCSSSSSDTESTQLGAGGQQLLSTAAAVLDLINGSRDAAAGSVDEKAMNSGGSSKLSTHQLSWALTASVYVALAVTVYLQERAPSAAAAAASTSASDDTSLSAADCCLALAALQLSAAALQLLLPVVTSLSAVDVAAPAAPNGQQPGAQRQQQRQTVLPVHEALECSLAAAQALATLGSLVQPALPGLLWQCTNSSSGLIGHHTATAIGSSSLSSKGAGDSSSTDAAASGAVRLAAAKATIAAAAAALGPGLQQLLSGVVLCWQAAPACSSAPGSGLRSSLSSLAHRVVSTQQPRLSVQAAQQQHLQQELRCWSAAALACCYGQLGARTWQGAVLEQFRDVAAPFADVQLQLGAGHSVSGHAAVLAAACPVLRQQLVSAAGYKAPAAASASAGSRSAASTAHAGAQAADGDCLSSANHHSRHSKHTGDQNSSGSVEQCVLKLSAAVDTQALQQALDFIYTGAAVLLNAGLAWQLRLCSECVSPVLNGTRQASQQRVAQMQAQQLQELQEQQQAARQQLHKLGMLARKLQLPLLAALTRGNRPQPGQLLPDLHLSFAALLPQQLLLLPGAAGQQHQQQSAVAADGIAEDGRADWPVGEAAAQRSQQQQGQLGDQPGSQTQHHSSSAQYLAMLAACAASEGDGAGDLPCTSPATQAADGAGGCAGMPSCFQLPSVLQPHWGPEGSFADMYLAAPVLLADAPWLEQGCGCRGDAAQAAGPLRECCGAVGQHLVYGLLPAHRVMLSACCPYFEALLSDRWRHDGFEVPLPELRAGGEHGQAGGLQQQQQGRVARVVVVPEADVHVAAALQHYLYTGTLQVQLPAHCTPAPVAAAATAANAGRQPGSDSSHSSSLGACHDQCQGGKRHHACDSCTSAPSAPAAGAGAASEGLPSCAGMGVALIGCCHGCHEARTLLRLWRCAELLLLPGLQALCVAAVEAAGWQLGVRCCLVLLADCCQLGVPAAADGLLDALSHRADREAAAALPEWAGLPAGLQAVLAKAWADRRRLQQEGQEEGALSGAPGGSGCSALAAAPPASVLVLPAAPADILQQQGMVPGAGRATHQPQQGVVLQQQQVSLSQQQRPTCEPVVVPWGHVQGLREAGVGLGSIVATQLQHPHS